MAKSECPFCGEITTIDGRLYLGKDVVCSSCEGTSQVSRLSPLELDYYYEGYEAEQLEYEDYGWEED